MLAECGAEIYGREESHTNLLMEIVWAGDLRAACYLLQGWFTAAGLSARGDRVEDTADTPCCTPLHLAAYSGNVAMVDLLLRSGADPNAQVLDDGKLYHEGWTVSCLPLPWAAVDGDSDPYVFDMSPLHIAILGRRPDVVRLLLQSGSYVNSHIGFGCEDSEEAFADALYLACYVGDMESVALLASISSGSLSVASQTRGDWHPTDDCLALAAREGNLEMLRLLLDADRDARHLCRTSWEWSNCLGGLGGRWSNGTRSTTLLHEALASGCEDVVHLIVSRGADPNGIETRSEVTGIEEPLGWNRNDAPKEHSKTVSEITTLAFAADRGDVAAVRALIEAGGDPNRISWRTERRLDDNGTWQESHESWFPMDAAKRGNHADVVQLLLSLETKGQPPAQ